MADRNDRNSKQAKRVAAQAIDIHHKTRTFVADPTHIAYQDKSFPVHHLTRRARIMLGRPADESALDS